jgi:hypothetical protein
MSAAIPLTKQNTTNPNLWNSRRDNPQAKYRGKKSILKLLFMIPFAVYTDILRGL